MICTWFINRCGYLGCSKPSITLPRLVLAHSLTDRRVPCTSASDLSPNELVYICLATCLLGRRSAHVILCLVWSQKFLKTTNYLGNLAVLRFVIVPGDVFPTLLSSY